MPEGCMFTMLLRADRLWAVPCVRSDTDIKCIHTYIHAYIHTYLHTYILTYLLTLHYITLRYVTLRYVTYIHTYIHIIHELNT